MTSSKTSDSPLSLVTGSCGFMGSTVVELLLDAGHRVRATDLESVHAAGDDPTRGRYPSISRRPGVEFRPADLTRFATVEGLTEGVDYIFHTAAVFDYSTPREILNKVNVEGTRNLLDDAVNQGGVRRLVAWGAGGVYGVDGDGSPFREDQPAAEDPPNNYLRSKRQQEELVESYGERHGLDWTTIRPTTVYGPRGVYGAGQLIMSAANLKVAAIPSNFHSPIPWVHVRDVARSALHLAQSPEAAGQYYNVNDDTEMSEFEFFRLMSALVGQPFVTLPPVPKTLLRTGLMSLARATGPLFRRLGRRPLLEEDTVNYMFREIRFANEKLKSTGFEFEYPDARPGLRDTVRWYKEEGWL